MTATTESDGNGCNLTACLGVTQVPADQRPLERGRIGLDGYQRCYVCERSDGLEQSQAIPNHAADRRRGARPLQRQSDMMSVFAADNGEQSTKNNHLKALDDVPTSARAFFVFAFSVTVIAIRFPRLVGFCVSAKKLDQVSQSVRFS
ncbi:hypothetical protein Rcae01_00186 [Novipirellula caenicola]|uniref:Uncharacterized protein n=1 Tax=Novipirellula caenicola TaxID=1536901 RepID=A0ABP9VHR3_9BACT